MTTKLVLIARKSQRPGVLPAAVDQFSLNARIPVPTALLTTARVPATQISEMLHLLFLLSSRPHVGIFSALSAYFRDDV